MPDPVIAQTSPYAVELEAGKSYYWCACGRSRNQPFCDGSHSGTGFEPRQIVVDRARTAYLCGCKHTATPGFCDGTHNNL